MSFHVEGRQPYQDPHINDGRHVTVGADLKFKQTSISGKVKEMSNQAKNYVMNSKVARFTGTSSEITTGIGKGIQKMASALINMFAKGDVKGNAENENLNKAGKIGVGEAFNKALAKSDKNEKASKATNSGTNYNSSVKEFKVAYDNALNNPSKLQDVIDNITIQLKGFNAENLTKEEIEKFPEDSDARQLYSLREKAKDLKEESSEETKVLVKDMIELAKSDPMRASQCILTTKQWVALAKTDPEVAGKLLFDQSNPPVGEKTGSCVFAKKEGESESLELAALVESLSKKLDSTQLSKVISGTFSREIERHPKEGAGTLLRANTVGFALFSKFNELHLNPIVKKSTDLKSLFKAIPKKAFVNEGTEKTGWQRTAAEGSTEKMEAFISKFLDVTSKLFLENNSQGMKDFRAIISQVKKDGDRDFGEAQGGTIAAAALIFLRFENPILASPSPKDVGVDFKYEDKVHEDNGKLLAKVTLNMANRATQPKIVKEPHVTPFNQIGTKMMPQMDALINAIADVRT